MCINTLHAGIPACNRTHTHTHTNKYIYARCYWEKKNKIRNEMETGKMYEFINNMCYTPNSCCDSELSRNYMHVSVYVMFICTSRFHWKIPYSIQHANKITMLQMNVLKTQFNKMKSVWKLVPTPGTLGTHMRHSRPN